MKFFERIADAIFAFRFGLPEPPEPRQPAGISGEWFADGRDYQRTSERPIPQRYGIPMRPMPSWQQKARPPEHYEVTG